MLKDQVCVVTGGGRGIGRAISLEMAQNGAAVAILYAGNAQSAKETVDQIIQNGGKATAYLCDVADFDQTKETAKKIIDDFGGVDILVNNAGITKDKLMLSMSEQDFDSVIAVNLKGAFNMIKHFYSHFMKKRRGKIINISSVSGVTGNAGQANYSSAKAGMIGLTKTVAKELCSRNINCNAIAPGFIETDMTQNMPEGMLQAAVEQIPLKRIGRPGDIAKMAAFLASENASYITGQIISIDGGLSI